MHFNEKRTFLNWKAIMYIHENFENTIVLFTTYSNDIIEYNDFFK